MKKYCVTYEFNGRKYWLSFHARNKKNARKNAKLKTFKIVSIDEEYPRHR